MTDKEIAELSVEEMLRLLLTKAISEGLVYAPRKSAYGNGDPSPMARTAGDMTGTANLLSDFLSVNAQEWVKRKGQSTGDA